MPRVTGIHPVLNVSLLEIATRSDVSQIAGFVIGSEELNGTVLASVSSTITSSTVSASTVLEMTGCANGGHGK
jgi:hypothetical protein